MLLVRSVIIFEYFRTYTLHRLMPVYTCPRLGIFCKFQFFTIFGYKTWYLKFVTFDMTPITAVIHSNGITTISATCPSLHKLTVIAKCYSVFSPMFLAQPKHKKDIWEFPEYIHMCVCIYVMCIYIQEFLTVCFFNGCTVGVGNG